MLDVRTLAPILARITLAASLLAPVLSQAPFDPTTARSCRARDGWVCVVQDKELWLVDAAGKATSLGQAKVPVPHEESGAEPNAPTTSFRDPTVQLLQGTPKGFALSLSQGIVWYGDGEPRHEASMYPRCFGPAGDFVVAAGAHGGSDRMHVAEVGADGKWSLWDTGLEATDPQAVLKQGKRFYVLAHREEKDGNTGEPKTTVGIWTSSDGAAWQKCRLPRSIDEQAYKGTPGCLVFRDTAVFFVGNLVLATKDAESFEVFERTGRMADKYPGRRFAVGETILELEGRLVHSTSDLRAWRTRPLWPQAGSVMIDVRDGKLVALARDEKTGNLVEWSEDQLVAQAPLDGPLPPPVALTQVELPGVTVLGMPRWTGASMLMPTDLGLHESTDGALWMLRPDFWHGGLQAKDCDSLAFGDKALVWRRGELRQPFHGRIKQASSETRHDVTLENEFAPCFGATDGSTLAFLSKPANDNYDGTGWALHVSRDRGATWASTPSPVLFPSGLDHGPLGWCVFGRHPQDRGKGVVAMSSNLASWRMSPEVERHPFFDAMLRAGDRIVAFATPSSDNKGTVEGMSVAVTTDGKRWTTHTIADVMHAEAKVVGRQIWLLGKDLTLASLDGETWRRMPTDLLPPGTESIVRQDGTWFVRCVNYTRTTQRDPIRTHTLWRRPAVTEAEIEAAPTWPAPLYQWLSPGIVYMRAVAEADARMTLAKTHQERIDALGRVGEAWRNAIPMVPASDALPEATAWYERLLAYETDDNALFDATIAVVPFLDKDKGEIKAFLMQQPKHVRDFVQARSKAMTSGQPAHKLGLARTTNPPKPQQQAAWFDVRVFRQSAANGNVGAMIDLMRAYSNGAGVPTDEVAARFWAAQAKRRGYEAPAQWTLAEEEKAIAWRSMTSTWVAGTTRNDTSRRDYDPNAALALFRRAADFGIFPAMFSASIRLHDGTESESAEGFALAQRYAADGNASGARWLGYLHELGSGVERSIPQAIVHYRRAAELGDATAMCMLGELQWFGIGMPVDREQGMRWLEQSAKLGNEEATERIAYLRESKSPWSNRPRKLERRVRNAKHFDVDARRAQAAAGDAAACYDMMQAHLLGLGVEMDFRWAQHWRARLVEAGGNPDGSIAEWDQRGSVHAALRSVELRSFEFATEAQRLAALQEIASRNLQAAHDAAVLALRLARTSEAARAGLAALQANADAGHPRSLVAIGRRMLDGDGVPKDPAKALSNFRLAAELGDPEGAWLTAFTGVALDADPGESLRFYLLAAGIEPKAPPPAGATEQDVWRHRDGEYQRLLAAAKKGNVPAMDAAAVLLSQPPKGVGLYDPLTAAALAWVAVDSFVIEPTVQGARTIAQSHEAQFGPQDHLRMLQIAVSLSQRISTQLDRELGRKDHEARVAASAPDRSKLKQAVQELLDGRLDGAMAGSEFGIEEALPTFHFPGLRREAAKHPGKRGEELLHAMAGVPIGDRAAYEKAIAKMPRQDDSMTALLEKAQDELGERRELRQVEVIRRVYGIGCEPDPIEAMAWLLRAEGNRKWHGLVWIGGAFTPEQWQQVVARLRTLQGRN